MSVLENNMLSILNDTTYYCFREFVCFVHMILQCWAGHMKFKFWWNVPWPTDDGWPWYFNPSSNGNWFAGQRIPFEKTQLNSLMNIYWHVLHFRTLVWNHNIFDVHFFQHPRCTTSCHANGTGEKHQLIEITPNPVMISPVRSLGFAIQNWWGHSFFQPL